MTSNLGDCTATGDDDVISWLVCSDDHSTNFETDELMVFECPVSSNQGHVKIARVPVLVIQALDL